MEQTQLTFIAIVVSVLAVIVPLLVFLSRTSGPKRPVTLDPTRKIDLVLESKENITHDTRRFRFSLPVRPSKEHVLGLPVGKHIVLSYTKDGEEVSRKYTPTSSDHDVGFVDFVIKVYFKGVHPVFPNGGEMSQYMESLKIGDKLSFLGPSGRFTYLGKGSFRVEPLLRSQTLQVRQAAQLGMIAGGTGITPMLQVIAAVLRDPRDRTRIRLLFANQTEEDILCRSELDALAAEHRERFQVWYTVDRPPPGWAFSSGFITKEMLQERLPPPGPTTQVLICGPPLMISRACKPALEALGFKEDNLMVDLYKHFKDKVWTGCRRLSPGTAAHK